MSLLATDSGIKRSARTGKKKQKKAAAPVCHLALLQVRQELQPLKHSFGKGGPQLQETEVRGHLDRPVASLGGCKPFVDAAAASSQCR